MKSLIITDLTKNNTLTPIKLSYFEVFVQLYIELFRDQLCQMGFKPKYECELSFL